MKPLAEYNLTADERRQTQISSDYLFLSAFIRVHLRFHF